MSNKIPKQHHPDPEITLTKVFLWKSKFL